MNRSFDDVERQRNMVLSLEDAYDAVVQAMNNYKDVNKTGAVPEGMVEAQGYLREEISREQKTLVRICAEYTKVKNKVLTSA